MNCEEEIGGRRQHDFTCQQRPGAVGPKAIAAHRLAVRSVRAPRTMKKSDVKRKKSSTPGFCILPERDGGTCEKRELFFSEEAIRAVRNRRPQPVRLPMRIAAVPLMC